MYYIMRGEKLYRKDGDTLTEITDSMEQSQVRMGMPFIRIEVESPRG